jgi:hypothetical protein
VINFQFDFTTFSVLFFFSFAKFWEYVPNPHQVHFLLALFKVSSVICSSNKMCVYNGMLCVKTVLNLKLSVVEKIECQ